MEGRRRQKGWQRRLSGGGVAGVWMAWDGGGCKGATAGWWWSTTASGSAWCWGSGRSGDEEQFWDRPEKFFDGDKKKAEVCISFVMRPIFFCGCELNFKFLNNLQPEWKQYGTMMRQNKNLMDINIDALYNILKQNQGDMNEAMRHKKKAVVVTSDPLALAAEKTKVSKHREKSEVQSESEGSDDDDISDLKKITALLATSFNRKKYYAKPTNNNLRTSSAFSSTNKKPDDEQVLLAEDQAWMESSSNSDQEISANMIFMDKMEKVLSDSEESSSSAKETIVEVSYYSSDFESESEYKTLDYYDNFTNNGLFVDNNDDQEIFQDAIEYASENFNENHIVSQKDHDELEVDHNDSEEKDH
ncbi:hypothetical protein Tco_0696347 [Tanacetum coccineum]